MSQLRSARTDRAATPAALLTEGALMVALSFALSFFGFEMPMGGKATPASMLPILIFAARNGLFAALGSGLVTVLLQLAQALLTGNVFVYCEGAAALTVCIVFDYVLPFLLPSLAVALFFNLPRERSVKGKALTALLYTGIAVGLFLRFACHFVSGVVIWKQWAPEGMSAPLYSLLYNGTYMTPELLLTAFFLFLLTRGSKELRTRLGI